MKKLLILMMAVTLVLAGCSSGSNNGSSGDSNAGGSASPDSKPSGDKVTIEVMMFEGGFGSEWVKNSAKQYMDENPNVTIEIQASPDIHQQLQPRFLSGDVPDLFNPGPSFDIMGLVDSGNVLELDEYLNEKAYNSDEKWLDTFQQGQFNLKKNGHYVGIPTIFSSGYVWWYDQKLFEDNGWELPETWDDLYELKKSAEEKGIAVFAFPGKYPAYSFYGYYMPLVQRIGGKQAILDAFNLKEGAWNSEAFVKAAEEASKMVKEGLFMEGSAALSHTEAQTLFFQRKALFATAGTWLEGEMKDVIPDDFVLRAMNHPAWNPGGPEQNLAPVSTGWGGAWYISKKSDNHEETVKFLKFLSSKEQVAEMVKTRGLASIVQGTDEAIQSESLKSALNAMAGAEDSYAPTAINDAYPELINNIVNQYQALLLGESTPEQFAEYAEKKAAEVRADSSVEKVTFD